MLSGLNSLLNEGVFNDQARRSSIASFSLSGISNPSSLRRIQNLTSMIDISKDNLDSLKARLMDNKIFLNMVIHDLRSPTVSVKIGLELTLNDLELIHKICDAFQINV